MIRFYSPKTLFNKEYIKGSHLKIEGLNWKYDLDEYRLNISDFSKTGTIRVTPGIKKSNAQEYFKNNDIASQDLFYNDIPSFVEKQYPGTHTFHLETNYDYKSIIKNYDEILPLYNYYKNTA
jgi:hypothetical protein